MLYDHVLLARGRGIAKLLEGLWNGDPVAWGITGVLVVGMIGWGIYKARSGDD